MNHSRLAPPRQPTGPTKERAHHAREGRQRAASGPLGYHFDPAPQFLEGLLRDGRINPVDYAVLTQLLRFRNRVKDSCWCSKATVAAKIGRCPRTVQRSLDRLGRAGVIEQRRVATPDPDDPGNRTGWRIVFLWLAPEGYRPGPGPERPGKGSKRGPGETRLSPPRGGRSGAPVPTSVSPPVETPVSPKSDGLNSDGETPPSSSSLRAGGAAPPNPGPTPDDDDGPTSSHDGDGTEGMTLAVEAVRERLGATLAGQIRAHARDVVGLVGGDAGALTAAAGKTADVIRRGGPDRIGDVFRYLLAAALDGRGMGPDAGRRKLGGFLAGRRLPRVSSEDCLREAIAGAGAPADDPPRPGPPPRGGPAPMVNYNPPAPVIPAEGTEEEIRAGLAGLRALLNRDRASCGEVATHAR